MVKLSFITADNCASLGVNGLMSFMKATNATEWDAVHDINDDFLSIIEKMQTYPYGFTQEFKGQFLAMLRKNKGKKCLVTNQWIISHKSPNGEYFRKVVGLLNEGLTLEAAKIKFPHN